ncbi:MAG: ComF family protein [bacterium]|nr:ComF family protein [bacterium]
MQPLPRFILGFLQLFFPRNCAICETALRPETAGMVCAPCLEEIEWSTPPWCPCGGKPFASRLTLTHAPDHLCADCRTHPPAFDRARALGLHEGHLRDAMHLYKYQQVTKMSDTFAPALARLAREAFSDTVEGTGTAVTFVPILPARWRQRGFDQAAVLGQKTARLLGLPFLRTLERTASGTPQTGLRGRERRRNLKRAFSVPDAAPIEGKRILLVDDVLTTGATASACANTLKSAGAQSVDVLTVCHVHLKAYTG